MKAPVLLDRPEAAAYTGLSVPTLDRRRAAGQPPRFVKLGDRVKYKAADLDDWMDKNTHGVAAA